MISTKSTRLLQLAMAAAMLSVPGFWLVDAQSPAAAQFSDSYKFLKAVRDREGQDVTDLLNEPGSTLVNTRDISTGESALHIVVARRDSVWINFLIQKGANPNIRDNKGVTPLILATQLRFADGVDALISKGARVDDPNSAGETPLILAVQLRDVVLVRRFLKAGANPDRTDSRAGMSARDYALADGRSSAVLAEIEAHDAEKAGKKAVPSFGPIM